jgi:hypothetical protein
MMGGKDLEGGGNGLFDDTVPEFVWRDWGKPQKTNMDG